MRASARQKVFATRRWVPESISLLEEHFDVEAWEPDSPPPRAVLMDRVSRVQGLLIEADDVIDAEVLGAAGALEVVSNRGVGTDHIDTPEATRLGILVGNTPGGLHESCADFTFGLILSAARRIPYADRQVRAGMWTRFGPIPYVGQEVHGKTLGILGLGAIGTAVARRARGFDMRVLYWSRTRRPDAEREHGVQWVGDLHELLAQADFVTVHVPLTDETHGIIGERELRAMKPSAVLVNTSRGGTVDSDALFDALSEGSIAAAAVDVTDPEPIPPDSPLRSLENLLITPHIAAAGGDTITEMGMMAARNIIAALTGEPMPSCVNSEALANRRAPR